MVIAIASSVLGIARSRAGAGVRVRAQRTQLGRGVGLADHCHRAGLMLAIEWSRFGHVEPTGRCIERIVEPESHVKCVNRVWIALVGVEPENLIEQDCFDGGRYLAQRVRSQIALIPGHAKVFDSGIHGSAWFQVAALYGKHVEREAGANADLQ